MNRKIIYVMENILDVGKQDHVNGEALMKKVAICKEVR